MIHTPNEIRLGHAESQPKSTLLEVQTNTGGVMHVPILAFVMPACPYASAGSIRIWRSPMKTTSAVW